MKRSVNIVALFVLLIAAVPAQTPAPAASPFIGQWKMNLEKTTFSPGPKPTTIQTYQWTMRPDGFIVGINGGFSAGGVVRNVNTSVARFDGKDYATYSTEQVAEFMATGKTSHSTLAFKPLDARSVQIIGKTDGKTANPTLTRTRTISADGKTMTDTSKGTNDKGQPVNNVSVYDRVL